MMTWRALHELYQMHKLPLGKELSPNWNGAPTQRFRVVLYDPDTSERTGRQMQWGCETRPAGQPHLTRLCAKTEKEPSSLTRRGRL